MAHEWQNNLHITCLVHRPTWKYNRQVKLFKPPIFPSCTLKFQISISCHPLCILCNLMLYISVLSPSNERKTRCSGKSDFHLAIFLMFIALVKLGPQQQC